MHNSHRGVSVEEKLTIDPATPDRKESPELQRLRESLSEILIQNPSPPLTPERKPAEQRVFRSTYSIVGGIGTTPPDSPAPDSPAPYSPVPTRRRGILGLPRAGTDSPEPSPSSDASLLNRASGNNVRLAGAPRRRLSITAAASSPSSSPGGSPYRRMAGGSTLTTPRKVLKTVLLTKEQTARLAKLNPEKTLEPLHFLPRHASGEPTTNGLALLSVKKHQMNINRAGGHPQANLSRIIKTDNGWVKESLFEGDTKIQSLARSSVPVAIMWNPDRSNIEVYTTDGNHIQVAGVHLTISYASVNVSMDVKSENNEDSVKVKLSAISVPSDGTAWSVDPTPGVEQPYVYFCGDISFDENGEVRQITDQSGAYNPANNIEIKEMQGVKLDEAERILYIAKCRESMRRVLEYIGLPTESFRPYGESAHSSPIEVKKTDQPSSPSLSEPGSVTKSPTSPISVPISHLQIPRPRRGLVPRVLFPPSAPDTRDTKSHALSPSP